MPGAMSSLSPVSYVPGRLDHLGIVAGVCREIGLAEWLDAQDEHTHERVSVGTATVAMILNGLGLSNRRLYLVPQFFATKPVERLLGPGITAEDLNDDCLGRALDWLYAHDPTTLFAGIALRARQRFGIGARQVHVDTTSFAVSGTYTSESVPQLPNAPAPEAVDSDLDAARNAARTASSWAIWSALDAHLPSKQGVAGPVSRSTPISATSSRM